MNAANATTFEELTIRLPDGYEAYARYFPADPCRGGVLFLHGIQSHCGWYEASARRLSAAGYGVLQPDRRGSGRNRLGRGHAESWEQLVDDAFCCGSWLMERAGADRLHLAGVSWGGKLVAAMHVVKPERTRSLTLITPGLFPLVGVSKAEMFRIGMAMAASPARLFDIPLNDPELFTRDPERIEFLKHDAEQIHQATAGFYLASRRMDRVVKKLADAPPVPIHLLLAGDERIIDNDKTRAFVRELGWPETAVSWYRRSRHTLEFEPDREAYLDDLVSFLNDPASIVAREDRQR